MTIIIDVLTSIFHLARTCIFCHKLLFFAKHQKNSVAICPMANCFGNAIPLRSSSLMNRWQACTNAALNCMLTSVFKCITDLTVCSHVQISALLTCMLASVPVQTHY